MINKTTYRDEQLCNFNEISVNFTDVGDAMLLLHVINLSLLDRSDF